VELRHKEDPEIRTVLISNQMIKNEETKFMSINDNIEAEKLDDQNKDLKILTKFVFRFLSIKIIHPNE
jgi:hypothetical protein